MLALLFDTETTGLIKNHALPLDQQPRIIELYGSLVDDDGKVHGTVECLVDPGVPVSEEITKITGITQKDVEGRGKITDHLDMLDARLLKADAVVAHNLTFDRSIVEFEYQRAGRRVPWPNRHICTVEATEHLLGYRLTLTKLHEHLFGEGFDGSHRARSDVEALARCWVELRKRGEV